MDVIVAGRNDIPKEVARVTRTVPIVMAGSYNPVEAGLVASLARPGGNITGLTANSGPDIEASGCNCSRRRLQWYPASPSSA